MAIPTVLAFRSRFPEFGTTSTNGASDELIQLAINDAALMCDETVLGDRHTQTVLFTAADDLARSPFVRSMKLVDARDETTYSKRRRRLVMIGACGIRVL